MSDFRKLEHSQIRCRFCGEFEGPFVDTYIDDMVFGGRIVICGPTADRPGCLGNMVQLFDYRSREYVHELKNELAVAHLQIKDLEARKTVTMPLSEFRTFVETGNPEQFVIAIR